MALAVASPLKWGTLDLFLSVNVTHHCIGNKHHDRTLIYVLFSIHSTACHTTVLKLCQYLLVIFRVDKLCVPKLDTDRVKFIAQIKAVHSTIRCVWVCVCLCGVCVFVCVCVCVCVWVVCVWNAFMVRGNVVKKLHTSNCLW